MCKVNKMGKNITLAVPDNMYAVMKEHTEVNWSDIARRAIEAFIKVLSKSEEAKGRITKLYGKEVESRVAVGIGESFNENKFPAMEGMFGFGYNASINFNANIQPVKNQVQTKKTIGFKEAFETATKESH